MLLDTVESCYCSAGEASSTPYLARTWLGDGKEIP